MVLNVTSGLCFDLAKCLDFDSARQGCQSNPLANTILEFYKMCGPEMSQF